MSRAAAVTLLIAIPFLVAADDDKAASKLEPKQSSSLAARQRLLVHSLNKPLTLDRSFDGVPIRDVLEFLADRHEISIIVNESAFREVMGDNKVSEQIVRIPKMPATRLRAVLEFSLEQFGGTFLVKGDQLEIVPKARAIREVFGKEVFDESELYRRELPLVNISAERVPLEMVLTDLADQSGRNVILDPRLKEQGKTFVTLRLLNTPIDTAVNILARFHDLTMTTVDNTYIVTLPERSGGLKP